MTTDYYDVTRIVAACVVYRRATVRVSDGDLSSPVQPELVAGDSHADPLRTASVRLRSLWTRVRGRFHSDEAHPGTHRGAAVSLRRLLGRLLSVGKSPPSSTNSPHRCGGVSVVQWLGQGRIYTRGAIKGFIPAKLPKLDLITDADCVAKLSKCMSVCGCKRATVQFIT